MTLVAGNQGQNEGGLKVVQVPGSNDFTVVPVDSTGQITTTEGSFSVLAIKASISRNFF